MSLVQEAATNEAAQLKQPVSALLDAVQANWWWQRARGTWTASVAPFTNAFAPHHSPPLVSPWHSRLEWRLTHCLRLLKANDEGQLSCTSWCAGRRDDFVDGFSRQCACGFLVGRQTPWLGEAPIVGVVGALGWRKACCPWAARVSRFFHFATVWQSTT